MKIIAVADIHVSDRLVCGRSRLPVGMRLMEDLVLLAEHHGIRHVFILGDMWNEKNPSMDVLLSLYDFFSNVSKTKGIKFHWLRGNHEVPYLTSPHQTMMRMFSEVCHIVIKPVVLNLQDTAFYLVPWYVPKVYTDAVGKMVMMARRENRKRILLSHIGLREGRLSASNIQIPQRVSVKHLVPDVWDLVLLGDYHAHQQLSKNVFYLGAPIELQFGDSDICGPWLVDTTKLEMEALDLPHRPPRFDRWTIRRESDQIPAYNAENYTRISCPANILNHIKIRFPDAEVRPIHVEQKEGPDLSSSRLSSSDLRSPEKLVERFLEVKLRLGEDDGPLLKELGMKFIKEAQNEAT